MVNLGDAMRGMIGGLLLVAGVGGLSYWGAKDHARDMQSAISNAATQAVSRTKHGITAQVEGRDITVQGLADTPEEKAALLAQLNDVPGRRIVRDDIRVLDRADPYGLTATKGDAGVTLSGHVPSEAARAALTGADAGALTLAAGAPAGFGDAANAVIAAAGELNSGEVSLSDHEIALKGEAQDPAARDRAIAAFTGLSDGWQITDNLELFDDGAPFSINANWDGSALTGSGKLPADTAATLSEGPAGTLADDMVEARISDADGSWTKIVQSALAALAGTNEGTLTIADREVVIDALVANPDAETDVQSALTGAAEAGADVTSNLTLLDDGEPFALNVDWDGSAAQAFGKLPKGLNGVLTDGPLGAVAGDVSIAAIADDSGVWPDAATAGLTALSRLSSGKLMIADRALTLTGVAPGADAKATAEADLTGLTGTDVTTDLTIGDDGKPVGFDVTYSADGGAVVTGKLPAGLTLDDIAEALGVPVTGDVTTAVGKGDADAAMAALAAVSAYLPEFESLSLTDGDAGLSLTGETAPGVDNELVSAALAADLGDRLGAAPGLATATNLPDDGATRTNVATGGPEVLRGGYWIPVLDFDPTADSCATEIAAIQTQNKINFVTGSARLDALSVRAVNAMTSVMYLCIGDAGLTAIVGGHTDSQGGDEANQSLSQARAEAVTAALIARGIPGEGLTATGYGESQPIADNETAEGRAANRRTTVEWVQAQ